MLTDKEIIKVLDTVKHRISRKDFEIGKYNIMKAYGLCYLVIDVILTLFESKVPLTHVETKVEDYIPLFTYENAEQYCNATKPNTGRGTDLWWRDDIITNPNPRITFVNWLLEQYD